MVCLNFCALCCGNTLGRGSALRRGANRPPPLTIKEHGIYERADGKIVAWEGAEYPAAPHNGPALQHKVGGGWYSPNGKCSFGSMNLIREIVVGDGWEPWNGGECPVDGGQRVEVKMRSGKRSLVLAFRHLWFHTRDPDDIIAYRLASDCEVAR